MNYNGRDLTAACLDSLDEGDNLHIVVVDNGSTEDPTSLQNPNVNLLRLKENTGFTGGNNVGIEACLEAGCDQVLILNNDTIVKPGAIQALSQAANTDKVTTPKVFNFNQPEEETTIAGDFNKAQGRWGTFARGREEPTQVQAAAGACLLFPREVLEKVGLFDEDFFLYYEDVDLCTRLEKAGIQIWLIPQAHILHHEGGTTGATRASPTALYYNHRNRMLYVRKHSSDQVWRRFVFRFTATRIPILLRYAISGDLTRCRAIQAGIKDFRRGRFGRADEWHQSSRK